jgi:hypothetical protein
VTPVRPASTSRSGRPARRRAAIAVLLIGAALAIGGIDAAGSHPTRVTASVVKNGVKVSVVVSADRVSVTYRPQRPGFHLYSITLPAGGVDGLGVPTRLAVRGGLRPVGPPESDQPIRMLKPQGLNILLPVYPDGPVTITLPVARTASTSAQIVVSYGACSINTCLVPVADLTIPVHMD